jgi:DNA-binding XRE family transcriptional regulator
MAPMPNIAAVLKDEISRIARKQLRAETASLKKAVASHRSDLAALKQRVRDLEAELRRANRAVAKVAPTAARGEGTEQAALRFSAKGLASNRRRLGLSAADVGLLVGASGQSVYLWESGKTRPRAGHLPAIAALRSMGKREASARLAALEPSS